MIPLQQGRGQPKVLQVLYSGLGGHASVAFSLLAGDQVRQWDASLLFVGVEPLALAYQAHCQKHALRFEALRSTSGKPWHSWRAIYASLRRLAPDVVILHSISSLPPVAWYCLVHKVRLIGVLHTPTALRSRAERWMANLASLFAKRVVVLTQAYRIDYLAKAGWCKRETKMVVIPNGIDITAFSALPATRDDRAGRFRIGMAARFSATKRQDVLVAAMAKREREKAATQWDLTLAGDGERMDAVRQLVQADGTGSSVEFAGHLDEAELISWFRSLDLYVHASEGEALSTSMLQAMAMGLPLLASDVPGITNLFSQTPAVGVLIRDNTALAFAEGIAAIEADGALRQRLGEAARVLVVDKYSNVAMFNSYHQLVEGP